MQILCQRLGAGEFLYRLEAGLEIVNERTIVHGLAIVVDFSHTGYVRLGDKVIPLVVPFVVDGDGGVGILKVVEVGACVLVSGHIDLAAIPEIYIEPSEGVSLLFYDADEFNVLGGGDGKMRVHIRCWLVILYLVPNFFNNKLDEQCNKDYKYNSGRGKTQNAEYCKKGCEYSFHIRILFGYTILYANTMPEKYSSAY